MEQETVTLQSSDSKTFELPKSAAEMSALVKNLLDDVGDEAIVPLGNVNAKTLAKVIEYCKFHVENPAADDDTRKEAIKKFDDDFVALDQAQLFDMILAANYLDIKDLLELTCEKVASMIKGKTPEEIRKEFNIQNDFTPAEEDEIRKENQWAFE